MSIEERYTVEFDREEDGRWIAEIVELPGILAYGWTQQDAKNKVFEVLHDATEIVNEIDRPPV